MKDLFRKASAFFNRDKNSDEPHSGSPGVTLTHIPPNILPSTSTNIPQTFLPLGQSPCYLAQIPCTTQLERIDYLEDKITDRVNRQILKISDAFAHIAGGPDDVTAVTTNHTVYSTGLQVLVTAPSVPVSLPSTQPNGLWSFMWTRNDRKADPSEILYPTIISPSGPSDLSADDYISALHENW
jgi:hypothetical protein